MARPINSVTPITGYSSGAAVLGEPILFDWIDIPFDAAETAVEAIERPGFDYHALRIREVRTPTLTATAARYTANYAEAQAIRDALRAMKPTLDADYFGVSVARLSLATDPVVGGPYDLLSVQMQRPTPIGRCSGSLTLNPRWLCRYRLAIKQREPGA